MALGPVVIFCNKKDHYLARICVASIRYFYPDVRLYLVKDYLNGNFDTSELEQAFNVSELDLGKKFFGWGTAKVCFMLSGLFPGERVLMLDADIIFAGRFLEQLYNNTSEDFVVNPEPHDQPYSEFVRRNYYHYDELNKIDPEFKFPGYFFNTGQLLVRTDLIKREDFLPYFDDTEMPFCKRLDIMPMPDQSLLNYFLPKFNDEGRFSLGTYPFMHWVSSDALKNIDLKAVLEGNRYPFLIHWAGCLRHPHLAAMELSELLAFFENYYYRSVRYGSVKQTLRKLLPVGDYYLRMVYAKQLKKLVRRKS